MIDSEPFCSATVPSCRFFLWRAAGKAWVNLLPTQYRQRSPTHSFGLPSSMSPQAQCPSQKRGTKNSQSHPPGSHLLGCRGVSNKPDNIEVRGWKGGGVAGGGGVGGGGGRDGVEVRSCHPDDQ